MTEPTHCRGCGLALVPRREAAGFDSETGEQVYRDLRVCPRAGWLDFFFTGSRHDTWQQPWGYIY